MSIIDEMIGKLCPKGVEYKTLGEISTITRGKRFVHADAVQEGVPCIHYGEIYTYYGISATCARSHIREELKNKMRYAVCGDVIVVGAGENKDDIGIAVAWNGKEPVAIHDACYILHHTQNSKYISYFMRTENYHAQLRKYVSEGKICSFSATNLAQIVIPVPPLPIQEEIVRILDSFTKLEAELEAELEARKKQYIYYRDKLLSVDGAHKSVNGLKYIPISEFAECFAGATPSTSNPEFWENGTIPWMSSGEVNKQIIYNTEKKITQVAYEKCSTKLVPPGTVVIALAGQGKTRGLVAITKIELCTNQSLCSVIPNKSVKSEYLYHFLRSQYQKLRSISSGDGTRGGLTLTMVKSFLVPIPPMKEQERIVSILDKFDALVNDLTSGLPAELAARRQQYEFYRDRLLSFTPISQGA